MSAGHKDDPNGRGPGATAPPDRSVSGTMPRIRPLTGGGAVVGQPNRPSTLRPALGGRAITGSHAAQPTRAPYEAPVRIVSGAKTIDGRIEAIGETSLVIHGVAGLADGERISARFALPMSQKVVSVPAGVAHRESRPGGHEVVTLAFSIVDEALRKELEGYVKLMHR